MTHSSKLLAISLVVVLGAAFFLTGGGLGHSRGILAGAADAHVASAAGIESSQPPNYAGDKAWEFIGVPVKIGAVKAGTENGRTTATAPAPKARLPW